MTAVIERDTCDHCGPGILAYVWAETASGGSLTWCGHCATVFEKSFKDQGGRYILDLRYMNEG